jgi:hemerythrin
MKWQPRYATGFPEIDKQHKTLFDASDQFRQTLQAGEGDKTYDLFLDFLSAYAQAHFANEERCMMAHLCPVAERNKHEHTGFLKLVANETARFDAEGFLSERAMHLLDMVDRWLSSHICRIDIQLKYATGKK